MIFMKAKSIAHSSGIEKNVGFVAQGTLVGDIWKMGGRFLRHAGMLVCTEPRDRSSPVPGARCAPFGLMV